MLVRQMQPCTSSTVVESFLCCKAFKTRLGGTVPGPRPGALLPCPPSGRPLVHSAVLVCGRAVNGRG